MSNKGDVLRYLTEHAGEVVYAQHIIDKTGLTLARVRNAINNMRSESVYNGLPLRDYIEVIVQGDAWRYTTEPYDQSSNRRKKSLIATSPAARQLAASGAGGRMFEEIGSSVDGGILVRCEDGRIYKATEI
jgi:hypothetical protein